MVACWLEKKNNEFISELKQLFNHIILTIQSLITGTIRFALDSQTHRQNNTVALYKRTEPRLNYVSERQQSVHVLCQKNRAKT